MASKRDENLWIREKNPYPHGAFDDQRSRGASIAEVAASLPARLLGAMKELKSSENLNEGGERDLFF